MTYQQLQDMPNKLCVFPDDLPIRCDLILQADIWESSSSGIPFFSHHNLLLLSSLLQYSHAPIPPYSCIHISHSRCHAKLNFPSFKGFIMSSCNSWHSLPFCPTSCRLPSPLVWITSVLRLNETESLLQGHLFSLPCLVALWPDCFGY